MPKTCANFHWLEANQRNNRGIPNFRVPHAEGRKTDGKA